MSELVGGNNTQNIYVFGLLEAPVICVFDACHQLLERKVDISLDAFRGRT